MRVGVGEIKKILIIIHFQVPVETRIVEVLLLMYIGSVLLQTVSCKESYIDIILHVREVREMRESCI